MSKVKKIQLSWIVVSDLKTAIKFYEDVVGLKLTQLSEEFGWAEMSGMEGGALLGIAQSKDQEFIQAGQNAVVTFTVENLNETIAEMTEKGVSFIGEVIEVPGHVKMRTFIDKDNNHFQIVEMLSNE